MIEPLKVEKILDKYTLILTGSRKALDNTVEGLALVVLYIAPDAVGGLPLVLSKGTVYVKHHLGVYLIASTDAERKTAPLFTSVLGIAAIDSRSPLNVDEKSLSGNPSNEPIRVGDLVVPLTSLRAYVEQLAGLKRNK